MGWTTAEVDFLIESVKRGDRYSTIADGLRGKTRNACIGKALRLGLCDHKPRAPRPPGPKLKRVHPRGPDKATTAKWGPPRLPPAELDAMDPGWTPPREQMRTLLELGNDHCRWPCWGPADTDFMFCADPTADMKVGQPYCQFHAALAHQSSSRPLTAAKSWL